MDKATWVGGPRDGQPLFTTWEQALDWQKERIADLEAALAAERRQLADCTRDGQRLSRLLAEEEDTTDALEAALRALVVVEPVWETPATHQHWCLHCLNQEDRATGIVTHEPDCPWVVARTLLKGEGSCR